MKESKWFSAHYISRYLCFMFGVAIILVSVFAYQTSQRVENKYAEMNSYMESISGFHSDYLQQLMVHKDSIAERDAFMYFGQEVIARYYSTHEETNKYRHLKPSQVTAFLTTIYNQSITYPTLNLSPIEVRLMALAYCEVESQFNGSPTLESRAGAQGLFQFMPRTAELMCDKMNVTYGPRIVYDMEMSVRLWFAYYHRIKSKYVGSKYIEEYTAIEYNSGRNSAKSALDGVPPDVFIKNGSDETKQYYIKIVNAYNQYIKKYAQS